MLIEFAEELTLLSDGRLRHERGGSRIHLEFHVAKTHLKTGREEFVLQGVSPNPRSSFGSFNHHEQVDISEVGEFHSSLHEYERKLMFQPLQLIDESQQ